MLMKPHTMQSMFCIKVKTDKGIQFRPDLFVDFSDIIDRQPSVLILIETISIYELMSENLQYIIVGIFQYPEIKTLTLESNTTNAMPLIKEIYYIGHPQQLAPQLPDYNADPPINSGSKNSVARVTDLWAKCITLPDKKPRLSSTSNVNHKDHMMKLTLMAPK